MNLRTAKLKIKIVSPDEKLNKQLLGMLQAENDCFGVDYSESHEECKKCTILAELGDKRAALFEFCKELTESKKEGSEEEMTEEEKTEQAVEKEAVEKEAVEEAGEAGEAEAPTMEEKPQKPEKVKKEKKQKAPKEKNVNEFDHRLNTQVALMDSLLLEGTTMANAEAKLKEAFGGFKAERFKHHIHHLKEAHTVEVEEKDGVIKIKK